MKLHEAKKNVVWRVSHMQGELKRLTALSTIDKLWDSREITGLQRYALKEWAYLLN